MIRRKFIKEQKLEIIKGSLEVDGSMESLAEPYKIHPNTLYKWRSEYLRYGDASFPGNGHKILSAEEQEISRMD